MQKAIDLTRESVEPSKASADMKDYLDKPLIVYSIETQPGKHGDIMFAEVSETETSNHFRLFVRGMKTTERLAWIKEHSTFPVEATFTQVGSVWEII